MDNNSINLPNKDRLPARSSPKHLVRFRPALPKALLASFGMLSGFDGSMLKSPCTDTFVANKDDMIGNDDGISGKNPPKYALIAQDTAFSYTIKTPVFGAYARSRTVCNPVPP
ncbi:hypothetical protein ElyMa_003616400 [Elysia marginata]|uniref:Uncharacterized protein n=1 Tax=Elysia marginata TaxID=1093978 RepID=A0AAV4ETJ6_9GAST|nr:hypothetical protein ElyMa_003616400 [Elysia marginata]